MTRKKHQATDPVTDTDATVAAETPEPEAVPSSNDDGPMNPASEAAADAAPVASAVESQLAEQQDKYLRLAAEYDNFRKRAVRERQRAEQEGMGLLIRGILDALDDLGRFAHVDPESTDARTVQEGAEMVEKKLLKHLAGHGLEVVSPAGQPFDPAVHEAVMTAPAESEAEDHLVGQVFQVGYVFNGQLLRAAKEVVKQWNG
jgi:molecular chaperone GrpE